MTATAKPPAPIVGDEHRPAGIVTRGGAAAVDLMVVLLICVGMYFGVAGARLVWSPARFTWPELPLWFSFTFVMGIAVLYLTASWAMTGRTYGDTLLGLRVLGYRRRKPNWAMSLVRAVFCVFFPVGLAWVVVSPDRRSIQDVVLRTVVVYDWHRTE